MITSGITRPNVLAYNTVFLTCTFPTLSCGVVSSYVFVYVCVVFCLFFNIAILSVESVMHLEIYIFCK